MTARRRSALVAGAAMLPLLMLGGCGDSGPSAIDNSAADARKVIAVNAGSAIAAGRDLPGTPMAERVAVLGLLNKRNGLTRDLTMRPGQALRVGAAVVRLRACEQTAPWELPPQTGAFVQLDVRETADNKWHRVFSGWLFKERPDYNVVQHPIYDVWVKSCTMSWPETGEGTVTLSNEGTLSAPGAPAPARRSSAPKSPAATSGSPGTAPETAASNSAE